VIAAGGPAPRMWLCGRGRRGPGAAHS